MSGRIAAIVTVGTELVRGLSVDTNTAEIAHALRRGGIDVLEAVTVGDDEGLLALLLRRCAEEYDVVVVTGGLGPTHDDITRAAASSALGLPLVRDECLIETLRGAASRQTDHRAVQQAYLQADVLKGARVLPAVKGTAPGQVIRTARASLVLLPGPPREMRPMLDALSAEWGSGHAEPAMLRCHGLSESDIQMVAQDVLAGREDIEFTVLARPGDVRAVLFDRGAGASSVETAAAAIADRLGESCYSRDGSSLAEVVLRLARAGRFRLATAESCTGGMLGAAITDVSGSSESYAGGVVAYADTAKSALLAVDPRALAEEGAVSGSVAAAMAAGARDALAADLAVSVTGVAGPGGGTTDKPVGTVWFGIATRDGVRTDLRHFPGDRDVVRTRAVAAALDLLRLTLLHS
jgi:nicotinamide-nucleotide amidase